MYLQPNRKVHGANVHVIQNAAGSVIVLGETAETNEERLQELRDAVRTNVNYLGVEPRHIILKHPAIQEQKQ